jgi:alkanesulfonate monooxygenase SsuD/methylene tetrahydromethanopterin reductase-like flavin-dependent oxidoreductase (luciferase family)
MRFGVGLWCLQNTATVPRHHVTAYRELREDAQLAERLGFDSAWLSEHHFFYDGYCPALLPVAATMLAVTQRLRVATGMLLLPLQDPVRVGAGARALADRSGGRFDLGVGLGYRDVEFDGKGVPRRQRAARLAAGLEALESTVSDVPLWIGSATPTGVARAGSRGHGVLLSGANPLPLVRELAAAHRHGWDAAGRPGGRRPPIAALRNVWVTDDAAEREAVLDWVRASYVLYAGLGWSVAAQGETSAMDFRRDVGRALADAVGTTIIGPAPAVVDGLREVAEAGVDDVVFRLVIEGAPRTALHDVMRRLSEEVMPQLAGLDAA